LASRQVALPLVGSYPTFSPLPAARRDGGRYGFCATFRGSPRLGVTQRAARWSPDLPPPALGGRRPPGPLAPPRRLYLF